MATIVTACGNVLAAQASGPGVTDIVEFTRIMLPFGYDEEQLRRQVSPDGTRAFILTRKANTGIDRNRYEILLLDLRPERLAAGRYEAPVSVVSLEPVVDDSSAYPSVTELRWVGDRTIVFRARLQDALHQVFQVDIHTRTVTQLTFSPTGVMSYAVSDDLQTVLYAALIDNTPMPSGQRSMVVGNQSFASVMYGRSDLVMQYRKYQYLVATGGDLRKVRSLGDGIASVSFFPFLSLSPDGRWAVLPVNEPQRHAAWTARYPLVAEVAKGFGMTALDDPLSYYSRPNGYFPMRLQAYRVSDGRPQAIVDAPHSSSPAMAVPVAWLGRGRSLIISGTHLPMDTGEQTPPGPGEYVVEYWPESGRWVTVAPVTGRAKDVQAISPDAFTVTDEGATRHFQRQADGSWQQVSPAGGQAAAAATTPSWSLRIRQDLNTPPEIVAEGPTGRWVALTRLNTQVTPAWGSMKPYRWTDAKGRQWDGGLLVPAGFKPGARHPLVIQTYGFSPKRFYLDGENTFGVASSGFAGRAFLKEGLLVLAFPGRATTDAPRTPREQTVAFADGVRAAIDALVKEGIVDRDRVGILGWSRTGERVLNLITFSDVPIRAATLLDGDANTLFSNVLTYAYSASITSRKEATNGGPPVGQTLPAWLRNDPSLHTDCIRAALRIEKYGYAVTNNWDIYSLLRRQYKAAEMIVMPLGVHGLHTPSERMLSLQGNVDWYRFWLTGGERTEAFLPGETNESLGEQYRRWRQMAQLKAIDDGKPACVRGADGF